MLQKWQNFAKSGHITSTLRMPFRRIHFWMNGNGLFYRRRRGLIIRESSSGHYLKDNLHSQRLTRQTKKMLKTLFTTQLTHVDQFYKAHFRIVNLQADRLLLLWAQFTIVTKQS